MGTKIYFRDMEGYGTLTEKQKKYVGKSAVFDLELLPNVRQHFKWSGDYTVAAN